MAHVASVKHCMKKIYDVVLITINNQSCIKPTSILSGEGQISVKC